jgi:hypothetical protein
MPQKIHHHAKVSRNTKSDDKNLKVSNTEIALYKKSGEAAKLEKSAIAKNTKRGRAQQTGYLSIELKTFVKPAEILFL